MSELQETRRQVAELDALEAARERLPELERQQAERERREAMAEAAHEAGVDLDVLLAEYRTRLAQNNVELNWTVEELCRVISRRRELVELAAQCWALAEKLAWPALTSQKDYSDMTPDLKRETLSHLAIGVLRDRGVDPLMRCDVDRDTPEARQIFEAVRRILPRGIVVRF